MDEVSDAPQKVEGRDAMTGAPVTHSEAGAGAKRSVIGGEARTMADIRRYKLEQAVTDAVGDDGKPTGDYWRVLGAHIARQSDELESMRRMMVFFTVLTVLGLLAGLILGIIGVVEISHATSTTSDLPTFP